MILTGASSMSELIAQPISLNCTISFPAAEWCRLQAPDLRLQGGIAVARLPFPDHGGPAPSLKIWLPEERGQESGFGIQGRGDCSVPLQHRAQESAGAHRTMYPVRAPKPSHASLFAAVASSTQVGPKRLSSADAQLVRETVRLPEFYSAFMADWRAEQVKLKQVKPGTTQKDRQTINRWEAWESVTPPANWPDGEPWLGLPIGYLTTGYLDRFVSAISRQFAAATVESTRGHLHAILTHAVTIGVLESAPRSSPLPTARGGDEEDDLDEDLATVWTDAELNRLYRACTGHPDLQAAIVIGCNVGPRARDLFQLSWNPKTLRLEQSPPKVVYRAVKTGKVHGIPLHPVVITHLDRLRRQHLFDPQGGLFPNLVSYNSKDPEKSHAARRRNKLIKKFAAKAGLPDHNKPWQVCRATCCTRLNNVRHGVGSWVIGQGTDRAGTKLAADHYDNPTDEVIATILATPQPEAFWE